MIAGITAYALATWCVTRLPFLPELDAAFILLPVALFGVVHSRCLVLSMFCLGGLSAYLCVAELTATRLPHHLEAQDLEVQGVVVDLPRVRDGITRFRFRPQTRGDTGIRGDVFLSWYHPEVDVSPGQIWQLTVRLNQPSGTVNFSLFDYEAWLFTKRISGRGYVRTSRPTKLLGQASPSIHNLRYHIRETSKKYLQTSEHPGLFNALAIGDTSGMSGEEWALLGKTGTTHLLVISGLHIGLIAVLAFGILRRLVPGLYISVALTIVVAACYGLLAGWGLPVQRAFVMLTVVLLAFCCGRRVTSDYQFSLALLFVLLLDPLATLNNGFWLSFGAVFLLFLGLGGRRKIAAGQRRESKGLMSNLTVWGKVASALTRFTATLTPLITTACRAQWIMFVGMAAFLAILLHQIPLTSFLVNLLAIPWVGLIVVPGILISVFLLLIYEPLGELFLVIPMSALRILTSLLEFFSELDAVHYFSPLALPAALLACLGGLLLLLPRGLVPWWLGLVSLFVLSPDRRQLQEGELALTFLDVGQGLSVIAATKSSVMLYDTGPSFGTRFSSARQIVLPTLRLSGRQRINNFIVSHPDNDHAGGMEDILSGMAVDRKFAGFLQNEPHAELPDEPCQAQWQVDSVLFKVFTAGGEMESGNDLSCLVLIGASEHWVLLTGDIESQAEDALLDLKLPPITVMSSPHHGSDTSSSPAFLNHVQAETVVISSGYRNRFSHPAERVLERYRNRSLRILNTAEDGAIRMLLTRNGVQVEKAREARPAIWRRD